MVFNLAGTQRIYQEFPKDRLSSLIKVQPQILSQACRADYKFVVYDVKFIHAERIGQGAKLRGRRGKGRLRILMFSLKDQQRIFRGTAQTGIGDFQQLSEDSIPFFHVLKNKIARGCVGSREFKGSV